MTLLAPILTPHGRLLLAPSDDAAALAADLSERLHNAFDRGSGHGLLQLGTGEVATALPPVFGYWRELGARYVTAVCTRADVGEGRAAVFIGPEFGTVSRPDWSPPPARPATPISMF